MYLAITPAIGPGTNWNNSSGGWQYQASAAACNRNEFSVTAAVQRAANEWPTLTLGLYAPNENACGYWKKFNPGSAYLEVTYNRRAVAFSVVGALS